MSNADSEATGTAMAVRVLYRLYLGENTAPRPTFYSKALCLGSMLKAVESCAAAELTVLQDGLERDDNIAHLLSRVHLELAPPAGNSGSFRRALRLACDSDWPDGDLVYLVEDDYLHTEDSLNELVSAAGAIPYAEYFSLYEHPNSRQHNAPAAKEYVFLGSPSRYWRTLNSTCMTFAARLGALRRDRHLFELASRGPNPADYPLWLAIQDGVLARVALREFGRMGRAQWLMLRYVEAWMARRRHLNTTLLVCPMPSMATHLDLNDGLAPAMDWEAVAKHVERSAKT